MSRYRQYGSVIGSAVAPTSSKATGVYDLSAATAYTTANLWVGTTTIPSITLTTLTQATGVDAVAATGGTITYSGNYKIHTYTGSGTFTPTFTGNVELMMIGGGGAAGGFITYVNSSGGSSGGMIYYGRDPWAFKTASSITLSAGTTYTVTIGAGGTWNTSNIRPTFGGSTTFVGGVYNLTAYGGMCGYTTNQSSGAGAAYWNPYTSGDMNTMNGAPAPGQGYPGAPDYSSNTYPTKYGAGGGGLGQPGGWGTGRDGFSYSTLGYTLQAVGQGGNGFVTDISGTVSSYGGGGGGLGNWGGTGTAYGPMGGIGGGGKASGIVSSSFYPGDSGVANTGGGGGGGTSSASRTGGNGGSGICIIRYLNI